MPEWFAENWQVIVTAALGIAVILWPQLKPIADAIKRIITPPDKEPETKDNQLMRSVDSANRLIEHFEAKDDPEGERLAREAAKALFEHRKTTTTKVI